MLGAQPWTRHVRIAGLVNLLLGVFLLLWPLVQPFPVVHGPLERSFLTVGALVAICSAARALFPERNLVFSVANFALGFWILISPVVFSSALTWQLIVESVAAGFALMSFAWWSISETLDARASG